MRIPRKFALVVAAVLFALLLAEGAVRLFFKQLPVTHSRVFCEFDPLLGWRLVPNGGGVHRNPDLTVREDFNSHGLRGPEVAVPKPDGVYRVLVLGDSNTEGIAVAYDRTFGEVLARLTGAEVINGGTAGYSTDQELLLFERIGPLFRPDLTVLAFYANDIKQNANSTAWHGSKPLFALHEDGSLELSNTSRENPSLPRPLSASGVRTFLERNVKLYRIYKNAKWGFRSMTGAGDDPGVLGVYPAMRRDWSAKTEHSWRMTVRLIEELAGLAKAEGSEFLVYLLPAYARVRKDMHARFPRPPEDYDFDRIERELEAACQRSGIEFASCSAAFLRHENPRRLYPPRDDHWNDAGHAIVGEELAKAVQPRLLGWKAARESER